MKLFVSAAKRIPYFRDLYKEIQLESSFSDIFIHERIIADKVRMNSYARAIDKYIKKEDVVVDLGTGTGILSFFAALNKSKKIYAIEHTDIIEKAKFLANCNNFKNIIFIKKKSKNFNISERIDLILHDQMGGFLFDEGMIDNVLDLRNRLLKQNGKILPSKFEIFIEPVKLKDDCTIPLIWEHKFFNFSRLKKFKEGHLQWRTLDSNEIDYFLCEPKEVLFFDLEKIEDGNALKKIYFHKKIKTSGRLDGFCFYFKTIFDKDIFFSTSPLEEKTHWRSRLFMCEASSCKEGDSIKFDMVIKDFSDISSWEWNYVIMK